MLSIVAIWMYKVQRADLTSHVIRKLLRLCCVDQSGMSIQILPEPRDTFFIKLRLYRKHLLSKEFLKFSNTIKCYYFKTRYDLVLNYIQMSGKIKIGLFWVNSATVHSRRLLPFLRDVLISLVKKARRAIDTWCMFSSSASLAFTAVIMHFRRLLLPLSRPWFWPRFTRKNNKVRI